MADLIGLAVLFFILTLIAASVGARGMAQDRIRHRHPMDCDVGYDKGDRLA